MWKIGLGFIVGTLAAQVQVNWRTLSQAQKIEVLNNRLQTVERYLASTGGQIKEYRVDSAIGELVCRACRMEEKQQERPQ